VSERKTTSRSYPSIASQITSTNIETNKISSHDSFQKCSERYFSVIKQLFSKSNVQAHSLTQLLTAHTKLDVDEREHFTTWYAKVSSKSADLSEQERQLLRRLQLLLPPSLNDDTKPSTRPLALDRKSNVHRIKLISPSSSTSPPLSHKAPLNRPVSSVPAAPIHPPSFSAPTAKLAPIPPPAPIQASALASTSVAAAAAAAGSLSYTNSASSSSLPTGKKRPLSRKEKQKQEDEIWAEYFDQLVLWESVHSHFNVPLYAVVTSEGREFQLGQWVEAQRLKMDDHYKYDEAKFELLATLAERGLWTSDETTAAVSSSSSSQQPKAMAAAPSAASSLADMSMAESKASSKGTSKSKSSAQPVIVAPVSSVRPAGTATSASSAFKALPAPPIHHQLISSVHPRGIINGATAAATSAPGAGAGARTLSRPHAVAAASTSMVHSYSSKDKDQPAHKVRKIVFQHKLGPEGLRGITGSLNSDSSQSDVESIEGPVNLKPNGMNSNKAVDSSAAEKPSSISPTMRPRSLPRKKESACASASDDEEELAATGAAPGNMAEAKILRAIPRQSAKEDRASIAFGQLKFGQVIAFRYGSSNRLEKNLGLGLIVAKEYKDMEVNGKQEDMSKTHKTWDILMIESLDPDHFLDSEFVQKEKRMQIMSQDILETNIVFEQGNF
jgi:hypothetical protein